MATQEELIEFKKKYIEYYSQLPLHKLASASIGKSEDTTKRWRDEDADFADQCKRAKADWALSKVRIVEKPEWLLERILKESFGSKIEVDIHDPQEIIKNALAIIKGNEPVSENK